MANNADLNGLYKKAVSDHLRHCANQKNHYADLKVEDCLVQVLREPVESITLSEPKKGRYVPLMVGLVELSSQNDEGFGKFVANAACLEFISRFLSNCPKDFCCHKLRLVDVVGLFSSMCKMGLNLQPLEMDDEALRWFVDLVETIIGRFVSNDLKKPRDLENVCAFKALIAARKLACRLELEESFGGPFGTTTLSNIAEAGLALPTNDSLSKKLLQDAIDLIGWRVSQFKEGDEADAHILSILILSEDAAPFEKAWDLASKKSIFDFFRDHTEYEQPVLPAVSQFITRKLIEDEKSLLQRDPCISHILRCLANSNIIALDHGLNAAIGNLLSADDELIYFDVVAKTFEQDKTDDTYMEGRYAYLDNFYDNASRRDQEYRDAAYRAYASAMRWEIQVGESHFWRKTQEIFAFAPGETFLSQLCTKMQNAPNEDSKQALVEIFAACVAYEPPAAVLEVVERSEPQTFPLNFTTIVNERLKHLIGDQTSAYIEKVEKESTTSDEQAKKDGVHKLFRMKKDIKRLQRALKKLPESVECKSNSEKAKDVVDKIEASVDNILEEPSVKRRKMKETFDEEGL